MISEPNLISIVIADDHEIFREGVAKLFVDESMMKVVATAADGEELIAVVEKFQPDVVLSDIMMPNLTGIEAASRILDRRPDTKIIALSMFNEESLIFEMLQEGAKGYLLKNASKTDLIDAVRAVYAGHQYFCKESSKKLVTMLARLRKGQGAVERPAHFTPKERKVIDFICRGFYSQEISETMYLSIRTIEGYRKRIYEKMKVKNSAGVVVYAIKHGMFHLPGAGVELPAKADGSAPHNFSKTASVSRSK